VIFVKRSPAPQLWAKLAAVRAKALAVQPPKRTFDQSVYARSDVKSELLTLFRGKCAYCESAAGQTSDIEVNHFRPKMNAMGVDGTSNSELYWWLAYDWNNLLPSCRMCAHLKGRRFPIEGKPAAPLTFGDALAAEKSLLLDPCGDQPDEHLVFADNGLVVSVTLRGRTTIDTLGLNREELVEIRKRSLTTFRTELQAMLGDTSADDEQLERLVGPDQEYTAARRQLLPRFLEELGPQRKALSVVRDRILALADRLRDGRPAISIEQQDLAVSDFTTAKQDAERYSIEDEGAGAVFRSQTRWVQKIEIQNFTTIENLTLEFPSAPGEGQSWLMLLGENGTGKSSVLEAVALALMGERHANRLLRELRVPASRFVRRPKRKTKEPPVALVRIHLTSDDPPIELRAAATDELFTVEPKAPKILLLGYGSTRLLPRTGRQPQDPSAVIRVTNLFDPFVPLHDAGAWMLAQTKDIFEKVDAALKTLLTLGDEDHFVRSGGQVVLAIAGESPVPLQELSDGYQSVIALACDIMMVMFQRFDSLDNAEGLVLLDEIDSHLHPRWQMRIVGLLRAVFKRVRFLVTTHNPLCLRGLSTGEVVVLRRDADRTVYRLEDLPPIDGLRADQLLTSEYFGLNSTIDPDLEREFEEYYGLLAMAKLNKKQQARRDELKEKLDRYEVFGATERGRLALAAADAVIAEDKAKKPPRPRALKAATKAVLRKLWGDAEGTP
jgi:uncharacterized protein (TIGR02646 family)